MVNKSIITYLTLIISFCLQANERTFYHRTALDGLSHNTVFDITQDTEGFIWIATGEGLSRYDSYGFHQYYSDDGVTSIPSNEVRALFVSSSGLLYVGTSTGLAVYNHEADAFTHILFQNNHIGLVRQIIETSSGKILVAVLNNYVFEFDENSLTLKPFPMLDNMLGIEEDNQGNLWGYRRFRLFQFDPNGNLLNTFFVDRNGLPNYIPTAISALHVTTDGQIMIGTYGDGPLLYVPENDTFIQCFLKTKETPHPMLFVRDIIEDQYGHFWIGTENGLFIYNMNDGTYEHFKQSFDPFINSINDNAIYKVFRSRENIMWLGTYFGGINYHKPFDTGFRNIRPSVHPGGLKGKALSEIITGPDGNLWIATEDAGIAIFDRAQGTFNHILNESDDFSLSGSNNVHSLTVDRNGKVWAGNFLRGVSVIDPKTSKSKNYRVNPGDPTSLINSFVFSIFYDSDNVIWIGTMNGIDHFDEKNEHFIRFRHDIFQNVFIYDIFEDSERQIWICSNGSGIYRYNKDTGDVDHFHSKSDIGLSSDLIVSHQIDSQGRIWFGSRDAGLFVFNEEDTTFSNINMSDGLPNNCIYGILEDNNNNLWLSSNKGITKYNYESGDIQNFTVTHGLVGKQFNYKSAYKTDDGWMYFGAVNGLCYFHPNKLLSNNFKPELHFINFRLFNEIVCPSKESVLSKNINHTEKIVLKHNQNVFSFDFIAINYYSESENNFHYYMQGIENDWNFVGNSRTANYTGLPPGNYIFRAKATNIDNVPSELYRSIEIIILPPFWKTNLAYVIYLIIIFGIFYLTFRILEIRQKDRIELQIEKIERENAIALHQHKLNFFTYISHELKTPLTLIIASVDSLLSNEGISDEINKKIIAVKQNAIKLKFLIRQLLEFRKIESDHAVVKNQRFDVVEYLKDAFQAYIPLFDKKSITASFTSSVEELFISFDPDKLEKIVTNLLSNAFKYTPEKGSIELNFKTPEDSSQKIMTIFVKDTGIGIPADRIGRVFDLFYKEEKSNPELDGTGIGLAFTKSLIKLLNGHISVESEPGKGSTFRVELPYLEVEKTEIDSSIPVLSKRDVLTNDLLTVLPENGITTTTTQVVKDYEILFVEDNKDLLGFLSEHFKKTYKVVIAENGIKALDYLKNNTPDLVVTDVMMPEMDGIELCKEIKTNFNTCHIPVFMLSAKSSVEARLEGLGVGADAYIPKPFLLSEIELQIRNVLNSKMNLKKHFLQFGNFDIKNTLNNRDQQFVEKVVEFIHENMDNQDLDVGYIVSEMGISRTLLHTKLKQILDLCTTEVINMVRLKEAKKLLHNNEELTVSEIAYRVGFNDPNYFSRTFKKFFRSSPSNFRRDSNGQQL
jgi:signal transduction histidine kinase/ligand-binding sensor domain-containing protein/AraC-like DNA-binding protein